MPEKVVYLLGAGFSHPLGIPIMNNFLQKSKDIYANDQDKYSYFEEVFTTIKNFSYAKNYYSADLFNIEEILSILEMQDHLSSSKVESSFKNFIIDVIKHYTPNITGITTGKGDWISKIFGGQSPIRDYGIFISCLLNIEYHVYNNNTRHDTILKSYANTNYSVVTLNYDSVIEDLCKLIQKNTSLDINGKNILGFSSQDHKNSILTYAKLHGSVVDENIIPPTWNKNVHNELIQSIWSSAYNSLSKANYIRIIGYSLPVTDSYIKYLLKSSVINCDNLKRIDVICLDDAEQSVYKRYEEFIDFKNFRFKSSDVIKYLNKIIERNDQLDNVKIPGNRIVTKASMQQLEYAHEEFMKS